MYSCPSCLSEMIWGGDHDYDDDYDEEGYGVVSNLTCHNKECDVDTVFIYTKTRRRLK